MRNYTFPKKPGVYVLVLQVKKPIFIKVGRLGVVNIGKGTYLYIGSARGSGGIKARVLRHLRRDKSLKWHIDYLTSIDSVNLVYVIYSVTTSYLEKKLVLKLNEYGFKYAIKGFGSTDTKLYSHLLKSGFNTCKLLKLISQAFKTLNCNPIVVPTSL